MFERATVPPLVIDGRSWRHREADYSPDALRRHRPHLYVLTDQPGWVDSAFAATVDGILKGIDGFSAEHVAASAFYVYFTRAEMALAPLRRIVALGGLFAPPPLFGKQPFHLVSQYAIDSYNATGAIVGQEPFGGLEVHAQLCQAAELTRDVSGDFVEIGVFSGSSALTTLFHMRNIGVQRRCWLFDTYAGFTYPAARDSSDVIWAGTHLQDPAQTQDRIRALVAPTGQDVRVVPVEICSDPVPDEITEIALANLDVDLYEAVLAGLTKLAPRMARRGIIVVEDPTSVPGLYGAYLALDEFINSAAGARFMSVRVSTQYFVIRVD